MTVVPHRVSEEGRVVRRTRRLRNSQMKLDTVASMHYTPH